MNLFSIKEQIHTKGDGGRAGQGLLPLTHGGCLQFGVVTNSVSIDTLEHTAPISLARTYLGGEVLTHRMRVRSAEWSADSACPHQCLRVPFLSLATITTLVGVQWLKWHLLDVCKVEQLFMHLMVTWTPS